jgi:hypothetical protein
VRHGHSRDNVPCRWLLQTYAKQHVGLPLTPVVDSVSGGKPVQRIESDAVPTVGLRVPVAARHAVLRRVAAVRQRRISGCVANTNVSRGVQRYPDVCRAGGDSNGSTDHYHRPAVLMCRHICTCAGHDRVRILCDRHPVLLRVQFNAGLHAMLARPDGE